VLHTEDIYQRSPPYRQEKRQLNYEVARKWKPMKPYLKSTITKITIWVATLSLTEVPNTKMKNKKDYASCTSKYTGSHWMSSTDFYMYSNIHSETFIITFIIEDSIIPKKALIKYLAMIYTG